MVEALSGEVRESDREVAQARAELARSNAEVHRDLRWRKPLADDRRDARDDRHRSQRHGVERSRQRVEVGCNRFDLFFVQIAAGNNDRIATTRFV